jgi:hypothetical protein
MDGVLTNLKRAGCTILRAKSQFCMPGLRVIGFVCDILKRYSDTFKVIKIVKWPFPNDIAEARTFIRMAVYYKVFVKNFAVIAALIYFLMRKEIRFTWDTEQQLAIDILKMVIITALALVILDYNPETEEIILAVNFNLKGWGATLSQIVSKYKHLSRYKSGL